MKKNFLIVSVSISAVFVSGCMTSRSRCEITYENPVEEISSAANVNTVKKYRIREFRTDGCASAAHDSVLREAAESYSAVERIMHTCPGVFESDGNEIFVDVVSYSKSSGLQWTAVPCVLTVGICPYFQCDETVLTGEVSMVSDPLKKARFSFRIVDDWKMSFLFQLGLIPYSGDVLDSVRIGKRGQGDVTLDVWREGIAIGVAKALKEIENKKSHVQK